MFSISTKMFEIFTRGLIFWAKRWRYSLKCLRFQPKFTSTDLLGVLNRDVWDHDGNIDILTEMFKILKEMFEIPNEMHESSTDLTFWDFVKNVWDLDQTVRDFGSYIFLDFDKNL